MAGLAEIAVPAEESCLGNETTIEAYVAHLVANAREVWRVLRDDGVYFCNLGDSYAGSGKGAWKNKNGGQKEVYTPDPDDPHVIAARHAVWRPNQLTQGSGLQGGKESMTNSNRNGLQSVQGLKPKDLCMVPARVALSLQADGWYLRNDNIWKKDNCMPSSAKDRCTVSHEYIFMLTKNPKYYFDNVAIQEPATTNVPTKHWKDKEYNQSFLPPNQHQNGIKSRPSGTAGYSGVKNLQPDGRKTNTFHVDRQNGETYTNNALMRNKRDVWSVNTSAFSGAKLTGDKNMEHFAVLPPSWLNQ